MCLSLHITVFIIRFCIRKEAIEIAPDFRPGAIGELCTEDAGAEKRIIFIETSGYKCLKPRQACAIESAALTNPDMTIYLYMATSSPPGNPEKDVGEGLERHCRTMELIKLIPNVQVLYEDLPQHLNGTPLESLYSNGEFNKSQYSYQHLSDALRVALLYKYGGIYLDLDVIVLRSLRCFRNTLGHVLILGQTSIENDVLVFDRGHKLLKFFMRWMKEAYKPDERSVIGPNGLTTAFRLFCNYPNGNLNDLGELFVCHDETPITMMYSAAFHPIGYMEQNRFFVCDFPKKELDILKSSTYSIHVYGSQHGATVKESSMFAFLASRFCPAVYRESQLNVYQF